MVGWRKRLFLELPGLPPNGIQSKQPGNLISDYLSHNMPYAELTSMFVLCSYLKFYSSFYSSSHQLGDLNVCMESTSELVAVCESRKLLSQLLISHLEQIDGTDK